MINVELSKDERYSVTFAQGIKTVPFYGDRQIVECDIWSESNERMITGRAVLNPLDTHNAEIGCRKALAAAVKIWDAKARKQFFDQLEPFFQQLQSKPKRPAGFNRAANE